MEKLTYKNSGVDLDVYAESMSRLPKLAAQTFSSRVMRLDGGFAGLFRLNEDGRPLYKDPVLISCADGVGTKLKVACAAGVHDTIGIDLVAMSVNDALCCGAEPLFFLDYVAMAKDDPDLLEAIVRGISQGCQMAGCALLGGETAIMPDVYKRGEYDLAGFCVGVAERENIIDGKAIQDGDGLLGIKSSGLHSNGFSLVRKAVFEAGGYGIHDTVPELGATVSELLLQPTRIYTKPVRALLEKYGANRGIRGIAHITGGGVTENIQRIVPKGQRMWVNIEDNSWPIPPIFEWIQELGDIDYAEMERVFNLGIGLVFVVDPDIIDDVHRTLWSLGEPMYHIGTIV